MWGARGLDSIISGLLESMSDRGPPPAKKDKVDAIPVVEATQEIVDESKWYIHTLIPEPTVLSTKTVGCPLCTLLPISLSCNEHFSNV